MKNLICFLFVAFLTTTGFSQRKGMAVKTDAAVERMTKELDLTPEQQVQIKAIYEDKIKAKRARNAETRKERSTARANFDQKIEAVLTPEQATKRKDLKAEHKEKMKTLRKNRANDQRGIHRGKGAKGQRFSSEKRQEKLAKMSPEMVDKRAAKSTERLDKQVNLSDAQEVSIKAAYLSFFQKNQAIAADATMDAKAKKERLTALKADHKATINSLLTEEQLAAKKAHKKAKKPKRHLQQH